MPHSGTLIHNYESRIPNLKKWGVSVSDKFRLMFDNKAKSREEIQEELKRIMEMRDQPAPEEPPIPEKPPVLENPTDVTQTVRQSVQDKIRSIVRDAVQTAQEERTESYGEKIPPREPRPSIDYLAGNSGTLEPDELAYAPSMYEEEDESSSIRMKIEEMRRLGQVFYNGYMLRQCAEETLVKQGLFMADVTDDFQRNCFCGIERPIYGALSTYQLRTYFTWRTRAREGVYGVVDKPYIMLYCFELLNKIGVISADDAYNRLSGVWEGCRSFCPALDSVIPRWLKDFRAYNEISAGAFSPAEEFSRTDDPADSAILEHRYSGLLSAMMERSGYNLRGSIFFKDNEKLLESALEPVLSALDNYFAGFGVSMFELLCGRLQKNFNWQPFSGALVDRDRMDGFRPLVISPMERYSIKRREPCLETFERAPYRNFIGWILKSIESVLRKRTGFRYPIQPNISAVLGDFANRERLLRPAEAPEFQQLIPDTVNAWCDEHGIFPPKKQKKRPAYNFDEAPESAAEKPARAPVEIDVSKLARIREESDETTRKLIVEEADTLPAEDIAEKIQDIESDSFEEQTESFAEDYAPEAPAGDFSALAPGWREFAESLTAEDVSLLKSLLDGTAEVLCRSRGVMPETEYDRINGSAMENIGDVLIENGAVIEDYLPDVQKIISLI